MSVAWLQPAAWWGLAALAVPIVIHLLFRPRSRRLPFPSLTFVRASRLAALRRRRISDWPLLLVRVLILAAAVAATAAPVLVTAARRAAWSARVARAIVVAPPSGPPAPDGGAPLSRIVTDERRSAFRGATFTPAIVGDGLHDAVEWLDRQPPAARELVLAGDLRDGALIGADVAAIPEHIGLRFLPVATPSVNRTAVVRVVTRVAEAPALFEWHLGLDDRRTRIDRRAIAGGADVVPVEVRAPAADQARADAIVRAVLAEGVSLPREGNRRLVVEFSAIAPEHALAGEPLSQPWMRRVLARTAHASASEQNGRLVLRTALDAGDTGAVHLVAAALREAFADELRDLEPRPMPAAALAAWSRPAGPVPAGEVPGQEGDRRYLWVAALALLAVEQRLRRTRRAAGETAAPGPAEVQVA